jgi:hypothetical protein
MKRSVFSRLDSAMTNRPPFDSPREVLGWAQKGIDDLKRAIKAFGQDNPFRIVTELDSEQRQQVMKAVRQKPLPDSIPRVATEILNNVRHSFDQATFAACVTLNEGGSDRLYFPWAESPRDLDGRLRKSIPEKLWPVFRTFEPYGRGQGYAGGDDVIRELAKIANRKHTVGVTFVPYVTGGAYPNVSGGGYVELVNPVWDPVKNEVIIARASADARLENNAGLALRITLDEPLPLKGKPIVETLDLFLTKAKQVTDGLETEAARIVRERNP